MEEVLVLGANHSGFDQQVEVADELADKIVADGSNPWCVSAGGPGDATGWQLTDWVEEVVLKTKGTAYYNDWINHKVTFEDPAIKDVLDKYVGKIFFTPNYVFGTNAAIVLGAAPA